VRLRLSRDRLALFLEAAERARAETLTPKPQGEHADNDNVNVNDDVNAAKPPTATTDSPAKRSRPPRFFGQQPQGAGRRSWLPPVQWMFVT
jgi:hypothetical protein